MVAACIKALTAVGPAIASGSHTWSGNWADLPTAPTKSKSPIVPVGDDIRTDAPTYKYVDDTTLSVDLIKEVGLTGDYLMHPSTLSLFKELSAPKLMNRESYENWTAGGSTDLHQRALQQAQDLVANHQPAPIGAQAQKEIDGIIHETEKELGIVT